MTLSRRTLLATAALAAAAPAQAQAPAWPNRPVRIIVPAPGGGGTADTLARIFAQELEKRISQPVIIENRGGAAGNIGATAAARAEPDGHTILWTWAGTLATNPAMYRSMPFDPVRDFTPVVLLGSVPNILIVNNDLPMRDLAGFTAYAKANPGAINHGTTGNGSSMHLAAELFASRTGTQLTHVPYAAPAAATTDLIAGRIQAMFNLVTGAKPLVEGGRVRAIAVLSETRVPQLPDVPTAAELGMPGLAFGTWFCLMLPKGADPALVARLNTLANAVLSDPAAKQRLESAGLALDGGGSPERLAQYLQDELRRHAELVRISGAQVN
ncbi:Bug family tripartite tricarboxylate transporter substrate binding protein [Falsiroseomonas selenitidurans]|uniref:Tripartite tricarboxylate transporter substrate binding protein n=1 Tax=Falsiroseomonas selenitidurans TaxID=2716335 RepID=A0ABX1E386_9PROT|nr:tripartite tricarboxylate transporter substrate binding protein [Falsiroseomonas selenitidurans]NKC30237.1 tripartite tricarboxylate transporter substrate binding protein [Falsiroseomonas selenitidurans]OYW08544.1 MAG: MFS transporter [Rhodospirillales bacterium 12-71-4]